MSIRARLLCIALLATLLPALLIGWRFVEERDRDITTATRQLPMIAAAIAGDLGDKIQGTQQLVYGLARARDLDTLDRAACSDFLSRVRNQYPQYTGILTIQPDGQLFCDSLKSGRDLDLRDRAYFQKATVLQSGITMEPAFGRLTGTPVLQIAYPVRAASDALRYVLLASLNLNLLSRIDRKDIPVHASTVLLVSHKGTMLAWSGERGDGPKVGDSIADSAVLGLAQSLAEGEVREAVGPDGLRKLWAVSSSGLMREAGLHVMVGQSEHTLTTPANRRFALDLLLMACIGTVLFVVTGFLAEWGIRRHTGKIANMVRSMGEGTQGMRVPEPHPRGELGALMAMLNQTAASLEQQRANIDALNAKLQESQRLESVGQLTGGVAHDFNNLLTVILGTAEQLAGQVAHDPKLADLAGTVIQAAQRGADLTQHLLAFARRQPLAPQPVDAGQLVASMDGLLRRSLGEHIELSFTREPDLWPALVDPAQLENAVLNLCLNARDAMPRGGQLVIQVANKTIDGDYAGGHVDVREGAYVMVAVSDSGSGIAPEHLARVFEPFFTTKERGKGTGLGLSMVYGFTKQSGGHVNVYSEVGHGTVVRLYLPRADSLAQPVERAPESVADSKGETVLMVEDDDMVRRYAYGQLLKLGYRVLEASDGPTALEIVRQHPEIDLLFTDVVMPGEMSGHDLAERALALRPHLKVLYTSGYTENSIVHQGRLDPGVLLLNKPYRRSELASKIREALAQADAPPVPAPPSQSVP